MGRDQVKLILMSTDNLYEFAGEFESLSIEASDLLEKNRAKIMSNKDIDELRELLSQMEYYLERMDQEANLMSEEERCSISIHTTCRQHHNEIRKRLKEQEERAEN